MQCQDGTLVYDMVGMLKVFFITLFIPGILTCSREVMVGISERLSWDCQQTIVDMAGCYIILQGLLGQLELIIVELYTPNGQQ